MVLGYYGDGSHGVGDRHLGGVGVGCWKAVMEGGIEGCVTLSGWCGTMVVQWGLREEWRQLSVI